MIKRLELYRERFAFGRMVKKLTVPQRRLTGVVLSLTSIRARLSTLHLPISRLLRGGFLPDHVEIWLSPELQPHVTRELKMLEEKGCCINYVEDIGPATKLLYCLGKHPDSNIISIDDDVLLPPGSLEELVGYAKKHPNTVICNMARRIAIAADGSPLSYQHWRVVGHASKQPEGDILPLGHGGVYYPSHLLNPMYDQVPLMKQLCPFGDDLWFTAMRLINGGLAFNTNYVWKKRLQLPETKASSIKARTSASGNNDDSIKRLFHEFDLTGKIRQLAAATQGD